MDGSERRRHTRHESNAPLILLEKSNTCVVRDGAILRDVSLGGLAFQTSLELKAGDQFEFALYIPTRGWVDGTGTVCWVKPEGSVLLCGASVDIREWDQQKLLEKWLTPSDRGVLKFFFPGKGVKSPEAGSAEGEAEEE